jgi:type I restriction enzyme S subunit
MSKEYSIPKNWIKTSIEEVILYQKGKKPKKLEPLEFEDSVPYLDIRAFERKEIRQYADKDSSQLIDEQDVVMVWDGARSGWVSKGVNGALGSTIARFRPFLFSQKYLFYFLDSQFSYINSNTKGTGIPHVDPQILWGINFPLPPLNEQHRIVSKIEELFSELDNGVNNLKLAQNQLKVYRQALLKYAFEGKLTEKWRKENYPEPAEKLLERIKEERQQRYEQELKDWKAAVKAWEKEGKTGRKPGKPKAFKPLLELTKEEIESLPKIPNCWLWQKNENYLFEVKDGTHDTPKYQEQGIPFITQKNIKNNKIDFSNVQYISEADHTKFYKRSNVEQGDIIISMIGAGRGECCIVNTNRIFSIKNVGLFKFFNELQSNLFYLYFFKSTSGLNLVLKNSKGGAQPFIGLTELRNWPLPVCSLEEQAEVANLLESQFSVIDNLEQTIESGLLKSEALRQSILKKAFEGKLVPQDPNDEPASELLKRIQAEKKKYLEEQKQQKKRKPKNTKKMSKELSIEEVLKASDKPMLAKDVWQKSKHKENIEDFYKELKDIQSKIKEVKKGTESLLSLAK